MKALIPAAGLGTRFLPATKARSAERLDAAKRLADVETTYELRRRLTYESGSR